MHKTVVVFDYDDTLTENTEQRKRELFVEIFRGVPHGAEIARRFVAAHPGLPRREMIEGILSAIAAQQIDLATGSFEIYHRRFSQAAEDLVLTAALRPGAEEVLNNLAARMPVYLNSANPQDILERVVRHRGWAETFRGIYGVPPGTKTGNVTAIIEREGVDPSSVVVIGDGESDLRSAEANQCRFIGIRGKTSLFEGTSFPVLDDLLGLPKVVGDLFR